MALPTRIPLRDLVETVEIQPAQSAAIVAQVAARLDRWMAARRPDKLVVPSLEDLAIERGGRIWWRRGACVPADRTVRALGALLGALLARAPQGSAPAGLLYLASRSTDPRHLAPLTQRDEFLAAVLRHAPEEPLHAVDALLARYFAVAAGLTRLTDRASIADVRRWRRAGGMSLRTIATDTGIPVSLLRELEWGVYANWPVPHAHGSIAAYAERAGLDADAVLAIVSREQGDTSSALPVPLARPLATADRRHGALPYAAAAALVLLLALAAPGDAPERVSVAAPPGPVIGRPDVVPVTGPRDSTPAVRPLPLEPHGREGATEVRRDSTTSSRPITPPSPPAASSPAGSTPRSTVRRSSPPSSNPIARVGRAIVGDGRHRVEPFPKPD
jgi:hypothetical protein